MIKLENFRGVAGRMEIATNSYLLYSEESKAGIIFDLANTIDEIHKFAIQNEINIKALFLTHCHADHIESLRKAREIYPDLKIYIQEIDAVNLLNPKVTESPFIGTEDNKIPADFALKDGEEILISDLKIKIIHTPGHTSGSSCYLINNYLISGDTLFKNGYGRTDLITSSEKDMINSLVKLMELSDEIWVYPGHGFPSTIKEEKEKYNF